MNSNTYYGRRMVELRTDTHQAVIHFFEKHEVGIRTLQEDEFFDILLLYLDSLFACGEYERFDRYVDEALILALDHRIYTLKDEDIYEHLLYRKAAVLYNIGRDDQCRHLLTELLRLNPAHKLARRFLKRCLVQSQREFRRRLYAVVILLILVSMLGSALEILWIRPFLPDWVFIWEYSRSLIFLLALIVWAGGLFRMEWKATSHVKRMQVLRKQSSNNHRQVGQPT